MTDDINKSVASDEQELAKALAGVTDQAEQTTDQSVGSADSATVTPGLTSTTTQDSAIATSSPSLATTDSDSLPGSITADATSYPNTADDLTSIKQQALVELRPLVDKLNVSNEEKFDTYLLLLRSTDDKELIAPAHEAAKLIEDETRRAQALLDIIKEIDFLSQNKAS